MAEKQINKLKAKRSKVFHAGLILHHLKHDTKTIIIAYLLFETFIFYLRTCSIYANEAFTYYSLVSKRTEPKYYGFCLYLSQFDGFSTPETLWNCNFPNGNAREQNFKLFLLLYSCLG